jgi:hypothetical protein
MSIFKGHWRAGHLYDGSLVLYTLPFSSNHYVDMKRLLLLLLLISNSVYSQINPSAEEVVRRMADHIVQTTSFQFITAAQEKPTKA